MPDERDEIIRVLREQNALLVAVVGDLRGSQSRLMTGYEGAHRRVADLCDTLAARLDKAESTTHRALTMQIEVAEQREELLSRKQERDINAAAARNKQAVFTELAGDVRALGLLFAKKAMGIPLTGNDSHGITDLLSTLTDEQIGEVFEHGRLTLTMGQRQSLGAVFQALAASKASAPAAQLETENTNTNTEQPS